VKKKTVFCQRDGPGSDAGEKEGERKVRAGGKIVDARERQSVEQVILGAREERVVKKKRKGPAEGKKLSHRKPESPGNKTNRTLKRK